MVIRGALECLFLSFMFRMKWWLSSFVSFSRLYSMKCLHLRGECTTHFHIKSLHCCKIARKKKKSLYINLLHIHLFSFELISKTRLCCVHGNTITKASSANMKKKTNMYILHILIGWNDWKCSLWPCWKKNGSQLQNPKSFGFSLKRLQYIEFI